MKSRFYAIFAVVLVASSAACASPHTVAGGPTTTTAADLPGSTALPSAPRGAESPATVDELDAPRGQLVCRIKNLQGTTELFLDWNGEAAKGRLHTVTTSGMVYDQRVNAERGANGLIVVDEPGTSDLVCHAAVIAPHNGKQHIRLGGPHGSHEATTQPWLACE